MDESVDKVILFMITTIVSAEASVFKCFFVFISHRNNLAYSATFNTSIRCILGLQRGLTSLHIFTNLLTYEVASCITIGFSISTIVARGRNNFTNFLIWKIHTYKSQTIRENYMTMFHIIVF